jgi:hypothetical protein
MTRLAIPILAAATLLSSHPLIAAIAYNFQSVSSGMTATTIAGRAEADGQNFRMNLSAGDGRLFKDDSVILSHDGGRTITVVDPSAKTYYDLELEQLVQSATSLFGGGGLFKLSVLTRRSPCATTEVGGRSKDSRPGR